MTTSEHTPNGSTAAPDYKVTNHERKIWLGIAVGLAVGIGISLSRRRKSRWHTARTITNRVTESSGEFVNAARELAGRVRNVCTETRKVVEGANRLWVNGRKLVGY